MYGSVGDYQAILAKFLFFRENRREAEGGTLNDTSLSSLLFLAENADGISELRRKLNR